MTRVNVSTESGIASSRQSLAGATDAMANHEMANEHQANGVLDDNE
jgi:hypothetical protein